MLAERMRGPQRSRRGMWATASGVYKRQSDMMDNTRPGCAQEGLTTRPDPLTHDSFGQCRIDLAVPIDSVSDAISHNLGDRPVLCAHFPYLRLAVQYVRISVARVRDPDWPCPMSGSSYQDHAP